MTPARYIIVAVIIAALAGAGMLFYKQKPAPAPVEQSQLPPVPVNAPPAAPLEKPRLWKLANDVECLKTEPLRFEAAPAKTFPVDKPIGLLLTNTCTTPQVIADIKYSSVALEYVSSRLPEAVGLLGATQAETPKFITLSRGGEACDPALTTPQRCHLLPLAPDQRAFIALPDQSWFLIKLAEGEKITGFSGLPQDPTKPVPVPKMPEMGFKIKGTGKP